MVITYACKVVLQGILEIKYQPDAAYARSTVCPVGQAVFANRVVHQTTELSLNLEPGV